MVTKSLLKKFMDGCCSPEELVLLKKYFLSGDTSELAQILEEDWNDANEMVKGQDLDNNKKRILDKLKAELYQHQPRIAVENVTKGSWFNPLWKRSVAAAVVLCILAFGATIFLKGSVSLQEKEEHNLVMMERKNNQDVPVKISLSDGSTVVLEPKSMLRYPKKFQGDKRIVRLEGQAFFDVSKDSLNPFFVKTNTLNVRVIGTSFNVSSFHDQPAEVSVVTGKVAVSVAEKKETMILAPNERAVRLNENSKLAKMLVEEPVLISREKLVGLFDFDEVPVSEVFSALEGAYDIKIRFDSVLVKNLTLKARLDDQSLFIKLDMICASLGLGYEVVGTDIVIKESGNYYQEK